MVESFTARIDNAFDHLRERMETSITYKRFKETAYDPDTGQTKTYWEQPTFNSIVLGVKSSEINSSGGRLKAGDCSFSFKCAEFTEQSGTNNEGESDRAEPDPMDEITYNSETWTTELEDGEAIWKRDATDTLFIIYARRRG